jgi:hypothetical protein
VHRDEDEPFREITVAEIEQAVGVFKDVGAELFKIRRKIERMGRRAIAESW